MKKFGVELKEKLKQLNVAKISWIWERFLKKIGSSLMDKPIKLLLLTIIIRCVFSEDDKFYPQLFLDDALYDV